MFTQESGYNNVLNVVSMLKDFSTSQAVTYDVTLVMSWKQCKIEMFVLQIANRK